MSRLPKRHFWEWFKRHNQEYLTLRNKPKKEAGYWLNELNAHLRAYYKFFGFSIEWEGLTGILTITVSGKAAHFKKVDDLVAKAPELPGWKFIALEIPRPIDFLLTKQVYDLGIDPREFSFSIENENPVTLTVYHPLCTPENKHQLHELVNSAVYNLLGERSYGVNIGKTKVTNLSYADPDQVQELEALPTCIDQCKSSLMVDSKGGLINIY